MFTFLWFLLWRPRKSYHIPKPVAAISPQTSPSHQLKYSECFMHWFIHISPKHLASLEFKIKSWEFEQSLVSHCVFELLNQWTMEVKRWKQKPVKWRWSLLEFWCRLRGRLVRAPVTSSETKLQISLRAQEDGGKWVRRLYTNTHTVTYTHLLFAWYQPCRVV